MPAPTNELPTIASIYGDHFDFVYRCARRLGVGEAWAEDVTQDVFVIVHRRLREFEGRAAVRTWLYAIVRNVVRDHRRSKHHRGPGPVDVSSVDLHASESTDESAARAQAGAILLRLLDRLDPERREVFVLAELEGFTAPEIAELTGANVTTVYTRIRAAREQMASGLETLRKEVA